MSSNGTDRRPLIFFGLLIFSLVIFGLSVGYLEYKTFDPANQESIEKWTPVGLVEAKK